MSLEIISTFDDFVLLVYGLIFLPLSRTEHY